MITPSDAVPLGRTGLGVTRLGLGMRPLGLLPAREQAEGREIIRAASRLGIGLFDTAPTYGFGESERRLGEVASELPASVVVSTKVGKILASGARRPVGQILADTVKGGPQAVAHLALKAARKAGASLTARPRPSGTPVAATDYSYDATIRSIEDSLERTGLDRFGIVFIHDPDDHLGAAVAGAYRALDRLRADGTIMAVGASSNNWRPLVHLADVGAFDCFLIAGRYSLLDQSALGDLLPMALERGISIIIGGVFNSGLLADPVAKPYFDYAPASQERLAQARQLDKVCRSLGVTLKAVAVQFPYGHPAVTSVLVGVASVAELEEDVRLASTPVPAALWEECRRQGLLADEVLVPSGR